MLSKILQINRNFISICIVVLFSGLILMTETSAGVDLSHLLSVVSVLVSLSVFVFYINSTGYYKNQYFAFLLMLFSFTFYKGGDFTEFYLAFLFLNIIQSQIVTEIRYGNPLLNSFDLGFFSGFVVLFYPPFVIYLIPMWIYYLLLGKVEFKKFLLNISGIIIFAILFMEVIIAFNLWRILDVIIGKLEFNIIELDYKHLFLVPVLILFIISFYDYIVNLNRISIHKKLIYFNAIIYTITTIVYLVLWGGSIENTYLLLALPLILFLTNYFNYNKKIVKKEIFLWVFVISLLLFKYHKYIVLPEFFDSVTF